MSHLATVLFRNLKKVMSHLRHRKIYKKPLRGPFLYSLIVTEICYSIVVTLWLTESALKNVKKSQQILSRSHVFKDCLAYRCITAQG